MTRLAKYSADLYVKLAAETGVETGMRQVGSISVALTQESVFASREAGELLALLRAWAEPASEGRLKALCATELFGLDAARLLALLDDETAWEAQLAANLDEHQAWQQRGFMGQLAQSCLLDR